MTKKFVDVTEADSKRGSASSFVDVTEGQDDREESPGVLGWGEALIEAPFKAFLGAGAQTGAMAAGAAGGENLEESVTSGRKAAEKATDWRLMKRTKKAEEKLGHWFEEGLMAIGASFEGLGSSKGQLPMALDLDNLASGQLDKPNGAWKTDADLPAVRTIAEAGAEAATFGIGGMLAKRASVRGAKSKFTDVTEDAPQTQPKQADLFDPAGDPLREYDPSPIDRPEQMVRGQQYRIDPAEQARLQADYDATVQEAARANTQRDLFENTHETLEKSTDLTPRPDTRDMLPWNDPDVNTRNTPAPLQPRGYMEERYPDRRPQPEGLEYRTYDPERIADQVEATDKPGFMRSAEEVMRARELEQLEARRSEKLPTDDETFGMATRREVPNERVIIDMARKGDQRAFDTLMQEYEPRLKRVLHRYVRDEGLIDDLSQEIFIKAYNTMAAGKYNPERFWVADEKGKALSKHDTMEQAVEAQKKVDAKVKTEIKKVENKFFTFLVAIAQNEAKNHFAKTSRRPKEISDWVEDVGEEGTMTSLSEKVLEGQDNATPENIMMSEQLATRLEQAIEALPKNEKIAIRLREIEGMPYEQIARFLNIPLNTVRTNIFNAREKLAKTLKGTGFREKNSRKIDDDLAARLSDANMKEFQSKELAGTMRHQELNPDSGINAVRAGLTTIAEQSHVPWYRELAKRLLKDEDFAPKLQITAELAERGRSGEYSIKYHEIRELPSMKGNEQLLLHEAMHARTASAIFWWESLKRGDPTQKMLAEGVSRQFKHLEKPLQRLQDLFDSAGRDKKLSEFDHYGMTDLHEFMAEGFTNPAFQAKLAQLKLPKELSSKSGLKYYWDAFVDGVAKMFGFKRESNTYFSELLRSGADLLEGAGREQRIAFATDLQKDLSFGAKIERNGIVESGKEAAREMKLDRRPMEQVVADDLQGKKLADFSPNDPERGWMKTAYDRMGKLVKENLLQDTTIALLMKNNKGTGPLIKWTVDQISRIDRDYMAKTKEVSDYALRPFRKMFHSEGRKDLNEMWKVWQENIGKRDLTEGDFKTKRQWDVYRRFQAMHDRILKEMNAKRVEAGYQPIERIPSYFHSMWEGDYRVFAYDAAGNKKWAIGYKTEWGARGDIKRLKSQHPELKWEYGKVVRDQYGLIDLGAFEEAMRVMSKDDPVTKAIQETYRHVLQHRGFGRTGLHKEGVLGFMGMGEGNKALRNMDRAFEQYVHQAYRYIGNLEKQKVLDDLQKIPLDARKQIPETMDFLYSYIHKARGFREEIWLTDRLPAQISEVFGLGESLPRNVVHGLSQWATIYWLTTPRFLASQAVQSINAFPQLVKRVGVVDGTKVFFDGWKETVALAMGKGEKASREVVDWASKKAYLDPTIRNLVSKSPFTEAPVGGRMEALKEIANYPAAWIEHHIVRLPALVMFEKALRDTVKDKEKRFEEAAQMTDYYMVNYGRVHAPMIYDKLGNVGEMARPLKQYSHNYFGQFMEYVSHAKNKGDLKPLASFFGTQIAVGGLKGALFVAEATLAVNLINYLFDTEISTPEQALLKSGLHDSLVYGGLSTVSGMDISNSVAAPGVPNMLGAAPVAFAERMITDVGTFALKFTKGIETDADRLRAWLAITPNAAHEWLKNIYTPKGQPTANPNDAQLRGNYRRTDEERTWAALTGGKPLNEAKADALIRNVKKELYRDLQRKLDATDAIVDRIQAGEEVDPALFQRYIENGGDPSRLVNSIRNRMKQRQQTGVERYQDSRVSPSMAHRLETMKPYLDNMTPRTPRFNPDSGDFE